MTEPIEPFEKMLIFFCCLSEPPVKKAEQIKRFRQISGLSEAETQSALDVCIVKGFVSDEPEGEI